MKTQKTGKNSLYARYGKRTLDIVCALMGFLLLWPVLLVTAVLVRWKLGGPVLFCQERPGLHGKIFRLYKFRTMTDGRDQDGNLLPDAERLTPFGRMLRAASLDELPELWNILRGDMSVVGPRPLLVEYLPLYNAEQAHRHDVRPGLTGYAQVHGRNSVTWEDKFRMDVAYVEQMSFGMDWQILWQTVAVVLKKDGIHAEHAVTMEKFTGTPETVSVKETTRV